MNKWEQIFKQKGKYFIKPQEEIPSLAEQWKNQGVKKILDLGCGSGRHLVYLAKRGFNVYGFDQSQKGISICKTWLEKEGLHSIIKKGNMFDRLPFKDDYFDAVLSIETLHHGKSTDIKKLIQEIERVLKNKGLIFIGVPKTRHQAKKYRKIAEHTYVPLDSIEKGLPHYYFSKKSIIEFFSAFHIQDIHIDKGNHYCFSGIKK